MAAAAQTNNCIADIASSANSTFTEILTLPLFRGGWNGVADDSCATASASSASVHAVINQLQHAISSIDLSVNVPHHSELGFFGYSIESNALSGKYALDLPHVRDGLSGALGMSMSVFTGVVFATIIYNFLMAKDTRKNKKQQPSSSSAWLKRSIIGSVLFTCCIFVPYAIIDLLSVTNTAARFATCIPFALYMFRILEAIFNFIPIGAASSSWSTYCAYFALPFDMVFDPTTNKPVMATKQDYINGAVNFIKAVSFIIGMCSIFSPMGYMPFPQANAGDFHEGIALSDYLDWRHLCNSFVIALFFQQGLALGDAASANLVQFTFGYKVNQMMHNPMLEATSPSDFWGRRWNVLVHAVMKRGVYKPVRKYSSSAVLASLAVFVASGLFHEWLVHAVFLYRRDDDTVESTAGVLLGSNTAFFVWNFVVIVSERLLAGSKGVRSVGKMIPSMFIPFVIIMTSLPMAHWFGNPYLRGGFFGDYERCLVVIRKVSL